MAQTPENRVYLFRLQIIIIDGGLLVLRNIIDQTLAAQGLNLSACLMKEKPTITHLKSIGVITQVQYDLLFPTGGQVPTTSKMDFTLIVCLLRCMKCFGLNKKFNWKTAPIPVDVTVEADIYRLKAYRNDISHLPTTTEINANDFVTWWNDIEQILIRRSSSALNIKQTIADFKTCHLDPEEEKRLQEEIKRSKDYEAAVDRLNEEMKKVQTDVTEGKKEITEVKKKVTEVEIKLEELQRRQDAEKSNEVVSSIETEEEKYQKRKKDLKDDLMIFYKWSHSKVLLSPLFEEKDTPLASFYIRPELNVNTLQDMFKTEGVANREIYLKADAGLGKTTFSKYLATTWCQAHCPDEKDEPYFEKNDKDCMRDFDFVFLVLLRDSNTSCSVDELIFKLIVSNLANSKSFTEELIQELLSREKCLVILDGLDEWTHPNTQCERAPRSIPHRNCVRGNCTILTTTRPWKLGKLNLSSNKLGETVELTKLSRDSAGTLVTRTLVRLKSPPHNMSIEICDATLVEEIFKSRVAHLAYVPLLLMYMICLRCEGFNIGNSKCELYVKIVELLLLRTTQKYGDISQSLSSSDVPACFAEHDKCKEYFTLLVNLGHLAYRTLSNETRENTLVFDGSVTKEYLTPKEIEFTLHSGILSESSTKQIIKQVSKVSFSHKTVQEFFAAIFISSEKEVQTIVLEKCRTVQDILDMSKICEFITKMNANRMCAISNDLMSVINEDEKTRDYRTKTGCEDIMYNNPLYNIQEMFMSCLQEIPASENIQLCLQDFFIDYNTEHSKQLQRLLKQNKTNIKSLCIDTSRTSNSLPELTDLFSLTDLSHIGKLYYWGDAEKEAEINRIMFPSLQYVSLWQGKWTNDKENLNEDLTLVQNLQYLHIAYFKLSHKILETFYNFISGHKSMKELTLNLLHCKEHGRHDCKGLTLDVSKHSTLSKLDLWCLPGRLQLNLSTPSLVNVSLRGINIDESSLLLSCDMLNIEHVELVELEISARSLQNFFTVLENLPQSVTVNMRFIEEQTKYADFIHDIIWSQTFHLIRYSILQNSINSVDEESYTQIEILFNNK